MKKHLFHLKRGGKIIASGYYENGKMVVLKGSTYDYSKYITPWLPSCPVLSEDKVFSSPSSAGSFCLNKRTCNGWTEWKDSDGNTLDAVYRKKSEE